MEHRILLSTLAAALLGIVGLWLLLSLQAPAEPPDPPYWPWEVSRSDAGQVEVFGLTLGQSRLAELRARLGETGTLSLFIEADGTMVIEAFFDDIRLSGLRADWVVTLDVAESDLADIYGRGLRISTLGHGGRKVTLAVEDSKRLAEAPLRRITYLPWPQLQARDLAGNFGLPREKLTEPGGIEHWLYPERGMDIARDPKGKVVIQYLNPPDFSAARARLERAVTSMSAKHPQASKNEVKKSSNPG
jgi:hypothetical protein